MWRVTQGDIGHMGVTQGDIGHVEGDSGRHRSCGR